MMIWPKCSSLEKTDIIMRTNKEMDPKQLRSFDVFIWMFIILIAVLALALQVSKDPKEPKQHQEIQNPSDQ